MKSPTEGCRMARRLASTPRESESLAEPPLSPIHSHLADTVGAPRHYHSAKSDPPVQIARCNSDPSSRKPRCSRSAPEEDSPTRWGSVSWKERRGSEDGDVETSTWSARECEVCQRLQGGCLGDEKKTSPRRSRGAGGAREEEEHVRREREAASSGDRLGSTRPRPMPAPRTLARESVKCGVGWRCASSVVRWYSRLEMLQGRRQQAQGQPLSWTILFLLLLASSTFAASNWDASDTSSRKGGVCQSLDIRNSVEAFSKLKGCRIIEGYLQILLIDNGSPADFANISFPELQEITGYLLLYRVNGLRNLGGLFPNLTVIRGHSLFINYAFVIFEMMSLQEIGLHNLTSIVRGSVRFEKNPALCYVDTIDWDWIAEAGKGENIVSGNNPRNGCPVCVKDCPARASKPEETLCWNNEFCLRTCKSECKRNGCDARGECCHPSCLGSCSGPTARDCAACRNVVTADRECRDRCPEGSFEFMKYRCISEKECREMSKPREAYTAKEKPYMLFNGSCVMQCPAEYMEQEIAGKSFCKQCDGPCLKKCSGLSVDSISSAQKLRGCTHITGSLEIQIKGGKNIVKELEENLSSIEEIDGYLKIVRSFSLISLNFLKKLRVIRGKNIESSKHTLTVLDNQNLQELWDWRWHPKIQILGREGGKVLFHLNPKLCLYKIETLREKADLEPFTDLEVSPNSNGDKVACNVTELRTRVANMSPIGAVIEWDPFIHHDARSLLGYVVYSIEAPHRNVTVYDGRDACGGDGWKVDDAPITANTPPVNSTAVNNRMKGPDTESYYLSHLKPYTQYAYYVKTYTIATERSGAQSNLTYFRTLPDKPGSPRSLSTSSNSSSDLVMIWYPPLQKNGNLTHYLISGRWEPEDANFIDQRNYCEEPMLLPEKKPIPVTREEEEEKEQDEDEKDERTVAETGTCDCGNRETDRSMRENEVSSAIAFEDELHNRVYVRRKVVARRKRQLSEMTGMSTMAAAARSARAASTSYDEEPIEDKIVNDTYERFGRKVPATNLTFVMRNLRHFSTYNIEVQACRAPEVNDTSMKCSSKSVRTYRTLPKEGADNIPPDSVKLSVSGKNNTISIVTLHWAEPPSPNGLIVTYQIEYKNIDTQDTQVRCITRRDFVKEGNMYQLKGVPPGNYTVKIRAGSLAGYGAYTQPKDFYIEERALASTSWLIFWTLFGVIVLLCFFLLLFYANRHKLFRNGPNVTLIAEVNPEYVSTPFVLDEWEVPREKIEIKTSLGTGSFGMVYEGIARDIVKGRPEVRCAVKTVNKDTTRRERDEFLNEAAVMKAFNAHHVVKLLGVVTRGQPILVIMELMANGDLKRYLRTHRPGGSESMTNKPPKLERILQMAIEIADGMAYLETNKFVHRDLAARNCMVAEDLTVKIGDFGMTRDVYEKDYYRNSSKALLPVRWMAPESLKDGEFSSYTDVWSYGVVLWEMVTFASQPYQGLSNEQVLRFVLDGGVMECPENCPALFYTLMERTWRHQASSRPTFMEITRILLDHINVEPFKQVSFYHSPEGMEARRHVDLSSIQDLPEEGPEMGESNSHAINSCSNTASKPGFLSSLLSTPRLTKHRGKPDYENRNLNELSYAEKRETVPLRQDFCSLDAVDVDIDSSNGLKDLPSSVSSTVEYVNKHKSETLNNGYIGARPRSPD